MDDTTKDIVTVPQIPVDLDVVSSDLVDKIKDEQDPDKLKDLVGLFNLNQSKKNLVRADTYSKLLDRIVEQMQDRITTTPYDFSNGDLLNYLSAIHTALDKNNVNTDNIVVPMIQNNNTQVNINVESLDRASKERVADAIKAIMSKVKNPNIDFNESCIEDIPTDD